MWMVNFQMFKLDLEKAKEPEITLPTSVGSSKKQESSRKTFTFAVLIMLKLLTVWITTNCGKFLKIWVYQTTLPVSWETHMQVKKQQLELGLEQLHVFVHAMSHQLCLTLWNPIETVACQAPLPLGFSRKEYWSRLLCPPAGDLPNPGIKSVSPGAPACRQILYTEP